MIEEDEDEDEDFNFDMEDDLVFNDEDDDDDDDDDDEESHKKMHDEHDEIKQSIDDLNQEVGYLTNALAASQPKSDLEMLSAKLKKSLAELEDIKAGMNNTFTSTDTISSTIQNLRGMLDALKKDQMDILSKQ
jgi:DNA repair exonuclease SbcCD ATPase subunit